MNSPDVLTAEQFAALLLEASSHSELVDGWLQHAPPADAVSSDVVFRLSRSLARYFQHHRTGYACFDLALIVGRQPDTVLRPAVACYRDGPLFAAQDELVTDRLPTLVIEVIYHAHRRDTAQQRAARYLAAGITAVWQVDVQSRELRRQTSLQLETIPAHGSAGPWHELPEFTLALRDLLTTTS